MSRPTLASFPLVLLPFLTTGGPVHAAPLQQAASTQEIGRAAWYAATYGDEELPRFRLDRELPDLPLFEPFAVAATSLEEALGPPTSGTLDAPPEYSPTDGVLFRYGSGWASVVVDCVAALTGDPAHDEKAYVVVSDAGTQSAAESAFLAAGADLGKVVFFVEPTDSIWLRDYGPHFVWHDEALTIADSHYYPNRPRDNFVPTLLAEEDYTVPVHPMGLYYSGGNFQPGPNRTGFVTALVNQDNPGFSNADIAALYSAYQGIDTLYIFPKLPGSVDGTGHIDMWMYLVDEDDVLISEFQPGSNPVAIELTDNAALYMASLGFTVHRVPAWNVGYTHYTYTNGFRVNDRIFVSTYASGNPAYADEDAAALQAWQDAAGPGVELVPIDCYSIIPAAGAIHCIVMQVPRRTDPTPAAHVCAPDGGEILVAGNVEELVWAASDDQEVTSVDLYCSTDGGQSFPDVLATGLPNDSVFPWSVPAATSGQAVVKVVAADADANTAAALSQATFEICQDPQTVYDFSTGAGVDRWAFGDRTSSWAADVDGNPLPVADELSPADYAALAASDATGGDGDPARYVSATPGGGSESTHVFQLTLAEDLADVRDIEVAWEGYGDQCLQMELYVWDLALGNWGDGAGATGENRYMANYAGNRDDRLVGHVQQDFSHYVDASGRITLLLYAERSGQESFHDYLSVTATHRHCQATLGLGGPGQAVLSLCGEPLGTGQKADLALTNAPPSTIAWLLVGPTSAPTPFAGGTLVPVPPAVSVALVTDPEGELWLPGITGGGGPVTAYLQFLYLDPAQAQGFGFTDAVVLQLEP